MVWAELVLGGRAPSEQHTPALNRASRGRRPKHRKGPLQVSLLLLRWIRASCRSRRCRSDGLQVCRDIDLPARHFDLSFPRFVSALRDVDRMVARRDADCRGSIPNKRAVELNLGACRIRSDCDFGASACRERRRNCGSGLEFRKIEFKVSIHESRNFCSLRDGDVLAMHE
jgi:hypothetical protein